MPKSSRVFQIGRLAAILLFFSPIHLQAQTPTLPRFGHVFIVVEENTNYSSVVGSPNMPYLNFLINKDGLATKYYADTHPSIGNYFALTTGQILTNDDSDTPSSFPVSADNIIRELNNAGKTWRDYVESLPSVGYLGGNSGNYYVRHNPIAYFTDVNCGTSPCRLQAQQMVPFTHFAPDLANNTLPQYSFIVPNGCDDAHNCSLSTADNWLKNNLDPLITSALFQKDGLLIIVFDENSSTGTSCPTSSTNCGGQVACVIVSPLIKSAGYKSSLSYNHESALRLMAQGLGLTTFPGRSSSANNMSDFFGTASTSNTPVASLSPTSLTFASRDVGTTSAAQAVTLKNIGNAILTISGITANGSFAETHTCGSSLAPNASCTISVSFSPQTTGTLNGTLSVSDNAAGSPQTVGLTGSGISSSGSTSGGVSLGPTALSFGTVKTGTTSAAQAVVLHNGTTSALTIWSVWVGWSYAQTNNCRLILPAGASCAINVTFTPLGTGMINENLVVIAGGVQHTTTLTGIGSTSSGSGTTSTAPSGVVSMTPTLLSFGSVKQGTTSAAHSVILHNGTSSPLLVWGAWVGWSYAQTNNCPAGGYLAAGSSCTIDVTFKPQGTGTINANLAVTAGGLHYTTRLTGSGT